MTNSFRYTVDSMSELQGPRGYHPWWALAQAVQRLEKSGKYPEAVAALTKEFNKIVGDDDEVEAGTGTVAPSDGKRVPKSTPATASRTGRKTSTRARRGKV